MTSLVKSNIRKFIPFMEKPSSKDISDGHEHGLIGYRDLDHILADMIDMEAYNVTIGVDGSVEFSDGISPIKKARIAFPKPDIPDAPLLEPLIQYLEHRCPLRMPNYLKERDPEMDLSLTNFTTTGESLGFEQVRTFLVGVYGKVSNPEALAKQGYVVFRPTF